MRHQPGPSAAKGNKAWAQQAIRCQTKQGGQYQPKEVNSKAGQQANAAGMLLLLLMMPPLPLMPLPLLPLLLPLAEEISE